MTFPPIKPEDLEYRGSTKGKTAKSVLTDPPVIASLCEEINNRLKIERAGKPANVLPFKDTPKKTLKTFRLRRFVTPFEFILELVLDGQDWYYHNWFPTMQTFYKEPENLAKLMLKSPDSLCIGGCYVYQNRRTKEWHRVRIHAIDKERKTVTLFLLDLYMVKVCEIYDKAFAHLPPEFSRWSAPLFRCYLYDVQPVGGQWSLDSRQDCQDRLLKKESIYVGIVCTQSETTITNGICDVFQNAGVVLIEKGQGNQCTVNAALVDKGYAISTGIFSCCRHSLELRGQQQEKFSLKKYQELFPEVVQPKESLCNTENHGQKPLLVFPVRSYANKESQSLKKTSYARLPPQIGDVLCKVKLSFVNSPSYFFIHKEAELMSLFDMQESLRTAVSNLADGEERKCYLLGQFVAGQFYDFDNTKQRTWCRCVVTAILTPKEKYKVLLIDHGGEVELKANDIRTLPEYFIGIQSFAYRAHLNMPWCIPASSLKWSVGATVSLKKYIFAKEESGKHFYLSVPQTAIQVHLQSHCQELMYSKPRHEWIADPLPSQEGIRLGQILGGYPQLSNFFLSHGINPFLDEPSVKDVFWHFTPISKHLSKKPMYACSEAAATENVEEKKLFHLNLFHENV